MSALEDAYERFCPGILRDVMLEVVSSEEKHGRLPQDPVRVNTILVEEVGEHAEAVLDLTREYIKTPIVDRYAHAREELVQVAAVAMRAIEALDREYGHAG